MSEREFWERCAVAAVEAFAPLLKQAFSGDSLYRSKPMPPREMTAVAALIADSMAVEWLERFSGEINVAQDTRRVPGRPEYTFGEIPGEISQPRQPVPTYTREEFERDQLGQTGDDLAKTCITCLGETDARIGVPETRCPQCGRRIVQQLEKKWSKGPASL